MESGYNLEASNYLGREAERCECEHFANSGSKLEIHLVHFRKAYDTCKSVHKTGSVDNRVIERHKTLEKYISKLNKYFKVIIPVSLLRSYCLHAAFVTPVLSSRYLHHSYHCHALLLVCFHLRLSVQW